MLRNIKKDSRIVCSEEVDAEPEFAVDSIIIQSELNAELQAKLEECLKALTPRQREAIFLRYYQNLSYEEVAAILNISVKASYKIIARSLAAMRTSVIFFLSLLVIEIRSEISF